MPLLDGARCPFRGKDAGSADSSAIGATDDAVLGAGSGFRRDRPYFAKSS